MRSCLMAGARNTLRTFSSKGFLLNSIKKKSYSDVQIIELIRFASLALQSLPELKLLPKEWLTSPNVLFPNEKHVSIFIPLRTEIIAGPDGDGYTDFHLEPENLSRLIISISHRGLGGNRSGRADPQNPSDKTYISDWTLSTICNSGERPQQNLLH